MCGLVFVSDTRGESRVTRPLLTAMRDRIRHRGPDGVGLWSPNGDIGMAHARLAILDVEGGKQPMTSATGLSTIVYNGEIYNYPSLRKWCRSRGRVFRTGCDTEVILALWELEGPRMVGDLDGMFAFVIWDAAQRRVFAAVDHLGIKPLYHSHTDGLLGFASEINPLRLLASNEVNDAAIWQYLSFGYVPVPNTVYQDIHRMEPGSWLLHSAGDGRQTRKYWSVWSQSVGDVRSEDIRQEIATAVASCMLSDVPVATLLSGGVDSSIIAYEVSQTSAAQETRAYTAEFAGHPSEVPRARAFAKSLGLNHKAVRVSAETAVSQIAALLWHCGQPFADSSLFAVSSISAAVAREEKVCLAGDGGDEIFLGYNRYRALSLASYLRSKGMTRLPRVFGKFPMSEFRTMSTLMNSTPEVAYLRVARNGFFAPNEIERWPKVAFDQHRKVLDRSHGGLDIVELFERADFETLLVGDYLTKVDIGSMMHGLEVRVPLLRKGLVEMCLRCKHEVRAGPIQTKKLPAVLYKNRLTFSGQKVGFTVPIASWLVTELRPLVETVFTDQECGLTHYVSKGVLLQAWTNLRAGHRGEAQRVWSALLLGLWMRFLRDCPTVSKEQLESDIRTLL